MCAFKVPELAQRYAVRMPGWCVRVLHGIALTSIAMLPVENERSVRLGDSGQPLDLHKLVHWQALHEESRRELGQPSTRHCDNDFMARRLH